MTVFLLLKDIHNESVRINVNEIESYTNIGEFTKIMCRSGEYNVQNNIDSIDRALVESYCTIKNVELVCEPNQENSDGKG